MEVILSVGDYLTEEEMRDLAIQEIRNSFRESSRATIGNLVSSAITSGLVFEDSDKELLRHKVKDAVEEISWWRIFNEGSEAQALVQQAIKENAGILKEKIRALIAEHKGNIEDELQRFVMNRIAAAFQTTEKE